MTDDSAYPVDAPGWQAIDAALTAVHGEVEPHQFASRTAYDLDSDSPLPAISVFGGRDPDHWHYVTYGLTELFEKSSAHAELSGFGFELTFRLARAEGEEAPPVWPVRLLQGIGGYVLSGHGRLDTGHCIDLGGPLSPEGKTRLTGVLCVPDPDVGKIETVHGSVLFLQLLGLTSDEVELIHDWDLERKVGLCADVTQKGITHPARRPFAEDPALERTWRRYAMGIRF